MKQWLATIHFDSTSNAVAAIRYYRNARKVVQSLDALTTGVATGTAKDLAELLLVDHHDPFAERVCRTAVISVQTPSKPSKDELDEIDEGLVAVGRDLQTLLGGIPMLGWVHGNTGTRHLHLIFPNSDGVRTLDLHPKLLREIQSFQWTRVFVTGRGRGRRKALPIFPKARKSKARDLAPVLLDAAGQIRTDQVEALVENGDISNLRKDQNGDLISFECGKGLRVRVATIRGFHQSQTQSATSKIQNECSRSLRVVTNPPPSQAEREGVDISSLPRSGGERIIRPPRGNERVVNETPGTTDLRERTSAQPSASQSTSKVGSVAPRFRGFTRYKDRNEGVRRKQQRGEQREPKSAADSGKPGFGNSGAPPAMDF